MRTADVIMTVIAVIGLGWTLATECRSAETVVKHSSTTAVQSITDADFADKALANGITVVEFSSNWCMPCRELKPIYEQVCGDCKGAKFYQFNIVDGSKADERYKITKIPCVIIFKDGREIARKLGHELLVTDAREKFVAWIAENAK